MKALNRIVTALLAIAVFPVAYFTDLITVYMHATIYDSNIVENLSVKRIIELFTGDGLFADLVKGGASELPDGLLKFKGNFIAFVVFFAIALLVALATVIVAAATNSRKATASLGAAGLLSIIGMRIAFSAVSSAVKAGTLTLGSLTAGLFCFWRSRAAGWNVPMNQMPPFSIKVPCSLVTEKSARIIRWAAMRPRQTTILGCKMRNCSRSQGIQASLSAGSGSRFWGGRHLTMLAM